MLVLSNFLLWSPFIILQQLSTTTIVISWQRSFTKASWSVIGRQWLSFKSESIPFRAEWQEMTLRVYPKFQSNFTQYETFLCPWKLLLFHVVTRALVCLFLSMFFSRPLLKSWSADQLKCLACTQKKRKRENKLPGGTLENCNLSVETAAPLTSTHNRLSDSSSDSRLGS